MSDLSLTSEVDVREAADVIFVDDESKACDLFVRFCRDKPYRPHVFRNPSDALEHFHASGADLVVTDLCMPEMSGIELLTEIRRIDLDVPAIVITAFSTVNTAINALRLGAVDLLKKPFDMDELLALIDRTLNHSRLQYEVKLLREQLGRDHGQWQMLIGDSEPLREIYRIVEKISDVRCNVIIEGESGTGKELVAKAIHGSSSSAQAPFVTVDCGSLNDTLLESELFGHEKGAFTGANASKKGLLEIAHCGTVFLDEIGNISNAMQVKLLRVIQEGKLTRVGGIQPIRIDVRWLAATNEDLDVMVREGRFRDDLFHRLNVVRIKLPPLRERIADIPLLVQNFIQHFNHRHQRHVTGFDHAGMQALLSYPWPGNVRELRNYVERSVILAEDALMPAVDLPEESTRSRTIDSDWPILEEIERRYIYKVLEHANGNQRKAAELLGIDKSTLWRKLEKYRQRDDTSTEV